MPSLNVFHNHYHHNFEKPRTVDRVGLKIYNPLQAPFKIYGLITPAEDDKFYHRLPASVAEKTKNESVIRLNYETPSGKVKFKTNSKRIAIFAKLNAAEKLGTMTLIASSGFDLYVSGQYECSFMPHFDYYDYFEGVKNFKDSEVRDITINFPLYTGVEELLIGLDEDATLTEGEPYKYPNPVLYYGSSITQGACASRPGNCYQAILERLLGCCSVNLGFSSGALGEEVMAEYIANLKLQAFVMDYDHNAPTLEHLKNTHEPFFKKIRGKQPDLPIVIVSASRTVYSEEDELRFKVVKATYDNALENGDKNVYFVDMHGAFMNFAGYDCTVDGIHPNDLGFRAMANAIAPQLKKALTQGKLK